MSAKLQKTAQLEGLPDNLLPYPRGPLAEGLIQVPNDVVEVFEAD